MIAAIASMLMLAQAETFAPQPFLEKVLEEEKAPGGVLIIVPHAGEIGVTFAGERRIGRGDAPEPSDYWHIGSNAKAMTAALALAMVEKDMISLESTVSEVLGDAFKIHSGWSDVTLEMLLTHRSGSAQNPSRLTMVRYIIFPAKTEKATVKARQGELKKLLKSPPDNDPGAAFSYSNLGYTLAGHMLGTAAGTSYEEALRTHLLGPLGMEMLVGAPEGGAGMISGHNGDPLEAGPPAADNPALMAPAGTLSFTAADYAEFLRDQLRGARGEEALLSPESYRRQHTPVYKEDGYALGWGVRPDGSLGHSGSNTFWMATALIDPESGYAVALLTNSGEADGLGEHLREVLGALEPKASLNEDPVEPTP
ncbi:beta-lactamase family protein [Parvularcula sp. ZS-1/3]|uniref:Beta-lactamase family protein n=1 Tax=Parvularcula mediterranea TaxID=2732508 RepID=A0A7Y3W6A4_9PROT|nr:serine hydrolase domain-containing protein [Parvularcula mediterranea]NNU17645.1 beta-lactamase family protein [Parvularcula mediterranea]